MFVGPQHLGQFTTWVPVEPGSPLPPPVVGGGFGGGDQVPWEGIIGAIARWFGGGAQPAPRPQPQPTPAPGADLQRIVPWLLFGGLALILVMILVVGLARR